MNAAMRMLEKQQEVQSQCVVVAYRALRAPLMARASANPPEAQALLDTALGAAHRALELAEECHRQIGRPNARDYVRAYWVLGAAYRAKGELEAAERYLSEALTRCRSINLVDHEADILLDLARLRRDQGHADEALRLADEALIITQRSGFVLQGADVHLFLARIALDAGDRATALGHAGQAHQLATCDGPPDYTYKVAYDESAALLKQLGDNR